MSELFMGMGLVGIVLLVSALASGIVERAPISFPIIFLGLGLTLAGTGVLHIDSHDPLLEMVGIISLALVLFLDAVNLQIDEVKREWQIPVLTLGPGTLLVISAIAGAAYYLLGTTVVQSFLLGAILASTDPVVLRDIVRDERIPRSVRRALSVEAGMNDLVVLPLVLIFIALLNAELGGVASWLAFLFQILVLSPLVGLVVGGVGAYLMGRADARYGIRQEYQALYGIGLVLAAFVAGQAVNGDGFLSAFFAGLSITLFNVTLCECFMDYGEITAEMMMLVAFVLFGSVLYSLLGTVALVPVLLLAFLEIVVIRPTILWTVLLPAKMSHTARLIIGWFGPRGLNSLLLALLVVQAGVPNADWLLAITGTVVLVSVVVHGASATPLSAWYGRRVAKAEDVYAEERESTFAGLYHTREDDDDIGYVSVDELAAALESDTPPLVLDVRSRGHYDQNPASIPGSIRVLPDRVMAAEVEEWLADRAKDRSVIAFCA